MEKKHFFKQLLHTILSMSGFIPGHMTTGRLLLMVSSLLFGTFILPRFEAPLIHFGYFLLTVVFYQVVISLVLSQNGLRVRWIKKYGEERAYRLFEGLLAFAFFHNALGLSDVSQHTANPTLWELLPVPSSIIYLIIGILFTIGMTIKIWSAYVLGAPLYYWKDMFLGRKVKDFVISGPYKFLSNPMYGVGQIQVYAIALYYGSIPGFLCGMFNQFLMFGFYYALEQPFIKRTYLTEAITLRKVHVKPEIEVLVDINNN